MRDTAGRRHDKDSPDIRRLIDRLVEDARAWAGAELAVADIALREIKVRALRLAAWCGVAGAAFLCVLITLSQALVTLLRPFAGEAGAALLLSLGFALAGAGALVVAGRQMRGSGSLLRRWLGPGS